MSSTTGLPTLSYTSFWALARPNIWSNVNDCLPCFDYMNTQEALTQQAMDYRSLCTHLQNTLNVKGKALFQPLRTVLTGKINGPEMEPVLKLLGTHRTAMRMQQAVQLLVTERQASF